MNKNREDRVFPLLEIRSCDPCKKYDLSAFVNVVPFLVSLSFVYICKLEFMGVILLSLVFDSRGPNETVKLGNIPLSDIY